MPPAAPRTVTLEFCREPKAVSTNPRLIVTGGDFNSHCDYVPDEQKQRRCASERC